MNITLVPSRGEYITQDNRERKANRYVSTDTVLFLQPHTQCFSFNSLPIVVYMLAMLIQWVTLPELIIHKRVLGLWLLAPEW